MQKITPFLWFADKAEEAMNFYVEVFNGAPRKNTESKVVSILRYEQGMETPGMPAMEGKVLTGVFELDGQRFMCLDGGPAFQFNEAVSMLVECEDQAEIDYFWDKLSTVPESEQCGWLKDMYGVSWQIVPRDLGKIFENPKAINAMLSMKKLDIAALKAAAEA